MNNPEHDLFVLAARSIWYEKGIACVARIAEILSRDQSGFYVVRALLNEVQFALYRGRDCCRDCLRFKINYYLYHSSQCVARSDAIMDRHYARKTIDVIRTLNDLIKIANARELRAFHEIADELEFAPEMREFIAEYIDSSHYIYDFMRPDAWTVNKYIDGVRHLFNAKIDSIVF